MARLSLVAILALSLQQQANAFTTRQRALSRPETTSLTAISRRSLLEAAPVAFLASTTLPAFAEDAVDDLAMPTEEEQKAADVSIEKIHSS